MMKIRVRLNRELNDHFFQRKKQYWIMKMLKQNYRMFLLLLSIVTTQVEAQDGQQITVDWIYSDAGGELSAVPNIAWLADGTAILQDIRMPDSLRIFERLNPETGERAPLLDNEKALGQLNSLLGNEPDLPVIPWPSAFSNSGGRAVYVLDGDIFLLAVGTSTFSKITDTDEAETSVSFSPDGSRLAYVRNNNLYTYGINDGNEVAITDDGSDTTLNGTLSWVYWEEIFGRRDIGYWWSPDSRSIAFLRTDESNVPVSHFVDFKPQVPRVIEQRYPKAGTPNPEVEVGIADLDTGEVSWLNLPDFEYLARVYWLPDGEKLGIQTMNRPQTELDLWLFTLQNGQKHKVFTETDTAWVNINDDLYFLSDGEHFIWESERDGYAHLYRFGMDGEIVNQITKGEWALRPSGGVFWLRQAVSAVDEQDGWIYFTALKESSIERHLYRIRFDGSGMERLTHERGTHAISFSPNGKYYFDTFSNITTPPGMTLHKADGTLLQTIAEPRLELLDGIEFQFPELLTIPTQDGFPMPAELLRPADFDPSRAYPIIFNVYGGPSAPTVFDAWNTARYYDQILLRMGYIVVRFDHRYATAISKILENGLNRMMSGPTEMKDIVDGVRWLKAQPWVDADRFGIWGWSGGGSFTLNAMTNSTEFKAGISVAPVTDWHFYDSKWAEFAMKTPEENPEGYEATSFVKSARNLHGKLLLVHGTYDDNVHPQNAWAFIEELIQHNIQFEMQFYPMRKHGIADRPARVHLYNRMLDFWKRYL